jgi:hypothetical protein
LIRRRWALGIDDDEAVQPDQFTVLVESRLRVEMKPFVVETERDLDRLAIERNTHLGTAQPVGVAQLEVMSPTEAQSGNQPLSATPTGSTA